MFTQFDLPRLAANAADFGEKSASKSVQALSSWIIGEAAPQLGVHLASPQEIYVAIAEEKIVRTMSFPAVNIRANTLDTARALFRAAIDNKVGALIVEIARSETGYTNQTPREFAAVVKAAAMMEGFAGPLFLQGDHVQLDAKKFAKGPEAAAKEIAAHSALVRAFLEEGFGSLDLDMSPFEKRTQKELTHDEQQADNARLTVEKIQEVRQSETQLGIPWTTLLGGETGEVGKFNTSREDLEAYARGIQANMERLGIDPKQGIRKIAVNDGTSHGGVPTPDGKVTADVNIEFPILRMATDYGRQFGWAGSVQHGASTLGNENFCLFPQYRAVEAHLATGFQNSTLDNGAYRIEKMQARLERYLVDKHLAEWEWEKKGTTMAQFLYSTRKKATGPFKFELWTMPEEVRAAVAEELYNQFSFLFEQLGVKDTVELVAQNTTIHEFHRPYPAEDQEVAALGPSDTAD
ncbi:class II fructose-bisphosphate aldolase [Candidatus Saganbacteria bacterium]|nr:class II fructose-bisphosphate aldolase [Candidatus Saganbacteria bacterium]